jgi:hypothetical protein
VTPITLDEHRARITRAQALMRGENLDAIVLASGSGSITSRARSGASASASSGP